MFKLKKEFTISCSHRLNNNLISKEANKELFGKCNNQPSHGHNYKIILTLKAEKTGKVSGMIMNFYDIKTIFNTYIDSVYDHQCLNNCPGFEKLVPTAENMCYVFYDKLKPWIEQLYSVEIYETDGASAIYEED